MRRGAGDHLLTRTLRSVARDLLLLVVLGLPAGAASAAVAALVGRAGSAGRQGALLLVAAVLLVTLAEFAAAAVQQVRAARVHVRLVASVRRRLLAAAHERGDQLGPQAGEGRVLALGLIDSEHLAGGAATVWQVAAPAAAVVGALIVAAGIGSPFAVLVAVTGVLAVGLGLRGQRRAIDLCMVHYDAGQHLTAFMASAAQGRDTVRGLGIATAIVDRTRAGSERVVRSGLSAARALAGVDALGRAVGVVALGGLALLLAGTGPSGGWTTSDAVTAAALAGALAPQLGSLAHAVGRLSTARAAAARIATVLTAAGAGPPATTDDPRDGAAGDVRLHGVTVRRPADDVHPDGTASSTTGRDALCGVDLDVPAGLLVAVCGPTGAGKSLLLAVIRGAVRPSAGTVRLGGRDPWTLTAGRRRAVVAVAEQEPFVYDDDLATNLAVAGDDPVRRAGALHGAAGDELPALLGGRSLGPRGTAVSGGQRRRIAVARALAAPAAVVLLDDPTGALDGATGGRLAAALPLRNRRTTLVVAGNDPAVTAVADLVVVLDEGRVVGVGSDTDLRDRLPLYRALMTPTARPGAPS